jgi:hypothetical protein
MARTRTETESKPAAETDPVSESDEQLLGAALAAALVEHRRRIASGNDLPPFGGDSAGWRMMARWGQLVDHTHTRLQGRP